MQTYVTPAPGRSPIKIRTIQMIDGGITVFKLHEYRPDEFEFIIERVVPSVGTTVHKYYFGQDGMNRIKDFFK